ncbi:hypothetical protein C8D95_10731 [Silicimonas algicola]|uniref:Uncharacterized protein n=1 Tax=Silicimonas algicola TaxID=1826607 RepID=A0A316G5Y8_9RHOB|nr:hypothetical protein C8D95_10731 [Silicimonas algicola]
MLNLPRSPSLDPSVTIGASDRLRLASHMPRQPGGLFLYGLTLHGIETIPVEVATILASLQG